MMIDKKQKIDVKFKIGANKWLIAIMLEQKSTQVHLIVVIY